MNHSLKLLQRIIGNKVKAWKKYIRGPIWFTLKYVRTILIERFMEKKRDLYKVFIDLKKTYYKISKERS